jgi:hypothetical protein
MRRFIFNMRLAGSRALSSCGINLEAENTVVACCKEIVESHCPRYPVRAWSFYFLGLIELRNARRTGELALLWQDTPPEMEPLQVA